MINLFLTYRAREVLEIVIVTIQNKWTSFRKLFAPDDGVSKYIPLLIHIDYKI